jgi:signal transduction histidine kinase
MGDRSEPSGWTVVAAEDSAEFRRLLSRAFLVPVLLLSGLALALGIGVTLLVKQARRTERSDRVLAEIARVRELLVDRETGLRGYLLSGDRGFLAPLERAEAQLGPRLHQLRTLLEEEGDQASRLDIVAGMSRDWSDYARRERSMFESGEDYIRYFRAGAGLQRLSSMLEVLNALGESEQGRRAERARTAAWTGRLLFWTSLGCLALLALVLGDTSRRQLLALARSHEAALSTMVERERQIRELNASLEQRVAERTRALEEANADLEAFSGSVSHDLRAPLRQLGGFTKLIEESAGPRLDARERSYLRMLRNTAGEAAQMVDDLLSFTRMSRAEIRTWTVDLAALVQSAREGLQSEVDGRRVEWTVHPLPAVQGDPSMLLLALRNLLDNALKYSRDRDPALIEVGTVSSPGNEDVLFIRDNGVGFDMKHVHKLFGVFQRLHRQDEFEGTGIGLAHVRRIVQRHGGRVWAVSAPEQGATFYLALPRDQVAIRISV